MARTEAQRSRCLQSTNARRRIGILQMIIEDHSGCEILRARGKPNSNAALILHSPKLQKIWLIIPMAISALETSFLMSSG